MDRVETAPEKEKDWETTSIQNLIRYRPSGTYFARFKIGRKLFRKSLETTVLSTARLKLSDKIKEYRLKAASGRTIKSGKLTFGAAKRIYLAGVEANPSLKPRAKEYRRTICRFLELRWPELDERDIRKVAEWECQDQLAKFQSRYSPNVVNTAIGTLRKIFQIAIDNDLRFDNPAARLSKVKLRQKRLQLPSRAQFDQFIVEIETAGARQSKDCANLVRFLAYSGLRIKESGAVTWADVNFGRKEITVRGDAATGTKNGEIRIVPMIPQLFTLLSDLRNARKKEKPTDIVMRVRECQKSMNRAAEIVGMARITHHDLRHLFATVCIENGCDIPTVSRWLGHKDGGALCMKTYGHLRQEHSNAQAAKISF